MIIHKRLNNNVVVVQNEQGKEQILMGRGLAFNKKVGDTILIESAEKVYTLSDQSMNVQFQELLVELPMEYVEIANDIIGYAKLHINAPMNESIIISLSDHIAMAVDRFQKGVSVKNVMLWDIKRFYVDEYRVGLYALDLIEAKSGVRLPNDEAGFVAFHLVNAQLNDEHKSVNEITIVMQEIENIVRYVFHIELDEESVFYYRFITHLKFFAQRLFSGTVYLNADVDGLYEIIQSKYKESYQCVLKIAQFIAKKYQYQLGDEEILYLCIHIARITNEPKVVNTKD